MRETRNEKRDAFSGDLQGFQNLVGLESRNTFTLSVIVDLIRDLLPWCVTGCIRVNAGVKG